MNEEERQVLRGSLRHARRNLNPDQQSEAAQCLHDLVIGQDFLSMLLILLSTKAWMGNRSRAMLSKALAEGKSVTADYFNRKCRSDVFAPYDNNTALTQNQWGVGEPPAPDELILPTSFDVVFVPLVGFSTNCSRLGMGKGFYDRTFSFKISNRHSRPLLVGLAHECQLTETFPVASWDVRLDAVITAEKIYRPDTA